jgi:replicative DNA helicase
MRGYDSRAADAQAATSAAAAATAEHAILGCLLLDNSAWERLGDKLRPEHFSGSQNRAIFAELARQLAAGKACDVLTMATALAGTASLEELNALAQFVPSAANLRRYADLVVERFQSRQLMGVGGECIDLAADHDTPIAERIDKAQGLLAGLVVDAPQDDWVSAFDGMGGHMQVLQDRQDGKIQAWPTGLFDLDDYLDGGALPGDLVIVGARPSMGKTALGLTIGVNMAEQYTVGLLSMEMSHSQLNDRLTAMLGRVSLSSVKRPARGQGLDWNCVVDGVDRARTLNLHISDQGGLNINQVRSKARALKRVHGLNVLVVDYIGLMQGLDSKANRNTQLEEISRGLKALAKELQICVLCLAQLSRKAEERPDQMPMLSDLRDSGAIEQDADIVVFIKRPIMANPDLGPEWQNYAKLSVAKNRQGRTGLLHLHYEGSQTQFTNWTGSPPFKPGGRFGSKTEL